MTPPIPAYIAAAPAAARAHLKAMRACVRKAAPKAAEAIKWRMPALVDRRILVMYAGFKAHVGFYPTPAAMAGFKDELKAYKTGRGSIQFPLDQPLPLGLIRRITLARVKQARDEDAAWRSKAC